MCLRNEFQIGGEAGSGVPAEAASRLERARGARAHAQGPARVPEEDTAASAQSERGLPLPQHLCPRHG